MVDRTYLSLSATWNECQNTYNPEAMFVEKVTDFLLSKSDWLKKVSGQKEFFEVVKKRVEKKLKEEKDEKVKETNTQTKVTQEKKEAEKSKKTQKVQKKEVGKKEALDLTNLKPDEADQEKEAKDDDGVMPVNNGGTTDKFVWTQTLPEVDLMIEVPSLPSKSFIVEFKSKHLKVGVKGEEPIIDADLEKEIDASECLWTISSEAGVEGKVMTITIVKKKGMEWWSRVCVGDQQINTQKIEPENSNLSDLDGDTRKTVEKMMFDQRQKAKGLPTSKELENKSKLKSFMDAHPEMDFSKCNFGGNGGFGGGGGFNMN